MIWPAVILGSIGCYVLKLVGYLLPDDTLNSPRIRHIAGLMPVALLAALVAVQTFGQGQQLVIDGRLAGLVAAVIALLLRAPFLVVILVAAATAALLRSAGWAA
jgi:uncharacterized membrane protein